MFVELIEYSMGYRGNEVNLTERGRKMNYGKDVSIEILKGKTIVDIKALTVGSNSVEFVCADGSKVEMWHSQDCCETVEVNDIEGDISDLIGREIVLAEEVDSSDFPAPTGEYFDSYTWTFYRLATAKGFVVIRWLGESNGFYSESVNVTLCA